MTSEVDAPTGNRPTVAVTLSDVGKSYGARLAVDGLSARLRPGITLLVGPNGAGKSTTLGLIAGLLRPSSGAVWVSVDGAIVQGEAFRRRLGVVRQESGHYALLTPLEHLQLAARLGGLARSVRAGRIAELVDLLDISRYARVRMSRLSTGERRRVHLAMALVRRPGLILLDEVTSGVDVETRRTVLDLVRRLGAAGTTICYSTHYLAEVDELRGQVVVLNRGRCIAAGPYDAVIARTGNDMSGVAFETAFVALLRHDDQCREQRIP